MNLTPYLTARSMRGTLAATAAVAMSLAVISATTQARADAPSSPPTATVPSQVGPAVPANGLLFGDTEDGKTADQTIPAMQSRIGRNLAMARVYSRWDDAQPTYQVTQNLSQGRVPLVSIAPKLANGTIVTWQSIASGAHDGEIRQQALGLKSTGQPLLLAFHHEANLAKGYGTADQFVAAFRDYANVVRSVGATNIALTVILTPYAYQQPAPWYPGDAYVDWLGADAYNFGACGTNRRDWQSLEQAAQPFYTFGAATGKPLVLAEWGAPEDPNNPSRRAQWITDAQSTFAKWTALKAAVYFDQTGSCDWHLGTTGPSADAFAALARSAVANGLATARLATPSQIGAAPLSATFDGSGSTGSARTTGDGVASWTLDFGDGASASGTGNPGHVTHTYAAGTWTATLTITGWLGRVATSTQTVTAAGAPSVTQGAVGHVGAGAVDLPFWIQTNQLTGSYYLQWGTTTALGTRSAVAPVAAKSYQQSVHNSLTGLHTGTRYYWQIVVVTPAGTTLGHLTYFTA